MKFSENAQHTLEYMILLMLIMAGIIVGGPYAIRSWNAQIKGWEDSVVDSMTDPLVEAPPSAVAIPGCDFVDWGDEGCGQSNPSVICPRNCTPQQMLQSGNFNPNDCQLNNPYIDCNLVYQCETAGTSPTDPNRNGCCTPWVAITSGCDPGDFGCPQTPDCGVNAISITGVRGDGRPGCEDGQYGRIHTCDSGYTEIECVADAECEFKCMVSGFSVDESGPTPTFPKATFCPGDNTALPDDQNYVLADSCGGAYCEFDCNPPFVPRGGPPPTYCDCPVGMNYGAPGYINHTGCGPNECVRGNCGPNECEVCPGCVCSPGWINRGSCPVGQYETLGCPAGTVRIFY